MFTEESDPVKDMHIGYIGGCEHLLKKMDGIILTKNESWQHRRLFHDPEVWKQPGIKTAADFDWLDPWLLNKTAGSSIVIEQFGDEFHIEKNIFFNRTRGYTGNIEDLFKVITYWYNKKRKWSNRKKWRDIEGVGHIYI